MQEQKLMLQIFEVREDLLSSSEPPRDTCFSTSPNSSNIGQYLMDAVRYYNLWTDTDTRRFLVDKQGFKLTKDTRDSPTIRYFTNNLTGYFPTNVPDFLRIFGTIAGIVSTIIRNSEKRQLKTGIDVEANSIQLTDQTEPLVSMFRNTDYIILNHKKTLQVQKLESLPEDLLEKLYHIVVATIDKNKDLLAAYQPVYEKLLELSRPPHTISKSIQQEMDSHRELEDYLKIVQVKNPMVAPIYNVTVPIAERTKTLLGNFIDEITKCKKNQPVKTLMPAKKAFFDPIEVINGKYKCIRQSIWCYILRKVLGKGPATDGKFYTEKHTEICVLRDAKLRVNDNGLMELLYKTSDNPEYAKHYTNQHSTFVADIKKLFDHLDLPLHADTACNDQRIFFSKDASQFFINHGLHLSREYVETCLVTSHRVGIFRESSKQLISETKLWDRILKMAGRVQLLEEDYTWATSRFKK